MFGDSTVQTERCLCSDCHWKCKPNHVISNVCQLLGDGRVCAVPGLGGWGLQATDSLQDWVTAAIALGRLCQIQTPQVWPIRTYQKKREISMKATIQLKQICSVNTFQLNAVFGRWMLLWYETVHRLNIDTLNQTKQKLCFTLNRCHDTASTTLEIWDKTLRCWHVTKYICINKDKWD